MLGDMHQRGLARVQRVGFDGGQRNGAVERAGIHEQITQLAGERCRHRAFARTGWPVNGDCTR